MANYKLVPSTESVYFIRLHRQQIGHVTKRAGSREWVGRIGPLCGYGATARAAFEDVCKAKNRVDLCGENNREKAAAVIRQRNEAVLRETEQVNKIFSDMEKDLGLPPLIRQKVRKRRVHI